MALLPYEEYVDSVPRLCYELLLTVDPMAIPYEEYVGSVPRILYDIILAMGGGGGGGSAGLVKFGEVVADGSGLTVMPELIGKQPVGPPISCRVYHSGTMRITQIEMFAWASGSGTWTWVPGTEPPAGTIVQYTYF